MYNLLSAGMLLWSAAQRYENHSPTLPLMFVSNLCTKQHAKCIYTVQQTTENIRKYIFKTTKNIIITLYNMSEVGV